MINNCKRIRYEQQRAIIKIGKPCTGRMIQKETGLESSVIARSLNNLWSGENKKSDKPFEAKIEKYLYVNCPITGRKAQHYRLKSKPGEQTNLIF